MRVQVHELDADLLEGPLRQQVALHARQGLVGIIISLLDEAQLLALVLVQPRIDAVVLLQPLEPARSISVKAVRTAPKSIIPGDDTYQ